MSKIAIEVAGLGKEYHIGGPQKKYHRLTDQLADMAAAPFRRAGKLLRGQAGGAAELDEQIWAIRDISFQINTGEVVGMLNSDDFYSNNQIISSVAKAFSDPGTDAVFGDLVFVDPGNLKKVVRTYSSKAWHPGKFARGFMPAHPTFFVRRKYYEQFGLFKTDYKIAADYELLIRFLYVNKLRYKYLPLNMVTMRKGGVSSNGIKSNIILNSEIIRGCRENGIKTNEVLVYSKYFIKLFEMKPWR